MQQPAQSVLKFLLPFDVAVFQPKPAIIWVGTGEASNRDSVGWGDGVYKSMDGGTSFVRVGLEEK